ncbi:hypothetical protein HN011_007743 [Eciton burchellii]|nr:hypothetical protein HN011_007743 [Eciton burchellii]
MCTHHDVRYPTCINRGDVLGEKIILRALVGFLIARTNSNAVVADDLTNSRVVISDAVGGDGYPSHERIRQDGGLVQVFPLSPCVPYPFVGRTDRQQPNGQFLACYRAGIVVMEGTSGRDTPRYY